MLVAVGVVVVVLVDVVVCVGLPSLDSGIGFSPGGRRLALTHCNGH